MSRFTRNQLQRDLKFCAAMANYLAYSNREGHASSSDIKRRPPREFVPSTPLTSSSSLVSTRTDRTDRNHPENLYQNNEPYRSKTVKQLQSLLRERGLKVKGRKDELIRRLKEARRNEDHF